MGYEMIIFLIDRDRPVATSSMAISISLEKPRTFRSLHQLLIASLLLCLSVGCNGPDDVNTIQPNLVTGPTFSHEWTQPTTHKLTDADLTSVWLTPDASEGWAIGQNGEILRYENKKWRRDKIASSLTTADLTAISFSSDGGEGWAVGRTGEVLRYAKGLWQRDEHASALTEANLLAIWLNPDGTEGWAVGGHSGRWVQVDNENNDVQWTFGEAGRSGEVLLYTNGQWQRATKFDMPLRPLSSLWFKYDGSKGFALSTSGGIIAFESERTIDDKMFEELSELGLFQIWLNDDGSKGWAMDQRGNVLHYDGERWEEDQQETILSNANFKTMWLRSDRTEGWAVGRNGIILRYENDQWRTDEEASELKDVDLSDIWISSDGRKGWAVGQEGALLACERIEFGPIQLRIPRRDLQSLNGNAQLTVLV